MLHWQQVVTTRTIDVIFYSKDTVNRGDGNNCSSTTITMTPLRSNRVLAKQWKIVTTMTIADR